MKIPVFTDEQLEHYADNPLRDMTSLEMQLAATVIKNREAFSQLREEIAPLARQIICPSDNTFSRQLRLIDKQLAASGKEGK